MTTPKRTLHAIGNAHIDPVWLWRWPEGLETIRATFRSALDRMEEYPDFVFTCSSSAFYAYLNDVDPEMLEEIRGRVAEGRWELVGGWWVEPDANLPCGESLIRQGLYGQRCLAETFGAVATVGYNPDTFGHPATLPQILSAVGLKRYVFMRPGTHEKELPGHVFRWRSPDGSEVLTARIARSYATWGQDLQEHVRASDAEAPQYVRDYIVFYGVGNHGGGPTRANLESIRTFGDTASGRCVELSSLERFFRSVEDDISKGAAVPVVEGELQYHARGCYAAHSAAKRENRRVEHLLMSAERLCAMARLLVSRCYPADELTQAWKALLFTQFHDVLAGTSLPEAYRDARDAQGFAAHIASRAIHGAIQAIASRVDTSLDGDAVLLFNPLPWPVCGPIEIERGRATARDTSGVSIPAQSVQPTTVAGQRRSCFVAELPALGYKTVIEGEGEAPPPSGRSLHVTDTMIENDWWRILVSPATGCPGGLYDKRMQVDVLSDPGVSLVVVADSSDTWSHGVASFRDEVGSFEPASGPVVEEAGPVRAAIRTHLRWGNSEAIHRLRLYRDLPLIDCEIHLNWQERHRALKLATPTRLENVEATYEAPYGSMARPADGTEQPGQQWADLTGKLPGCGEGVAYGLALLNDSKYGFDALAGELRMTLARSPVYAHHDPAKLDPSLEYQYMDQGDQTVRYRLIPHAGGWREADVPRLAMELNVGPIWVNEHSHAGPLPGSLSFLSVEPSNVMAVVCKAAEDGEDLIVRCVETVGRAAECKISLPALDMTWTARFSPYQIRTFRVSTGLSPTVSSTNGLEEASVE